MEENYLLPFLWVHGETEEIYRNMVNVIHDCGIRAFCVEARPHPQFCQEQWWKDMEIILDEAEKLQMKVWILDDKHFPTGYAAGKVERAPLSLRRRHIVHRSIRVKEGETVRFSQKKMEKVKEKLSAMDYVLMIYAGGIPRKVNLNEMLSCTAYSGNFYVDLQQYIKNGRLEWRVPSGEWSVEICTLTYDSGIHRNYINMINPESCRLQIDAVYEPHYRRFGEKFGSTIAGFFSDEPELGNGRYTFQGNVFGTEQSLPYSEALAEMLKEKIGDNWGNRLPLLWLNSFDKDETAKVRYIYMDCVTKLVEESFSKQIGMWCREHGVEYIGHLIEDNNQHAHTGTSLGHYFRGLKWQTMAGIDDIGVQVYPGCEDARRKNFFGFYEDGEFYHYALGKLGASMGELNPNMNGRTMCEIFGNYGWTEGVQLEKYLLDHFMVRGVNHFVPHAFTCKKYPDLDCPPHFYAQGNHPQYRHFGKLMQYATRMCTLISNGHVDARVGILYHGEAEWAGKCMMMQKPAHVCYDAQIDFRFVPGDVFVERDFYHTDITDRLKINGREHTVLIVPYAEYLPRKVLLGIGELIDNGGRVIFINGFPKACAEGGALPQSVYSAEIRKLDDLVGSLALEKTVRILPENNRLRVLHYLGDKEIYFLVNESDKVYEGKVKLQTEDCGFVYDAMDDVYREVVSENGWYDVYLESHKSICFMKEAEEGKICYKCRLGHKTELSQFRRSICRSIDYPNFTGEKEIRSLESLDRELPKFSGYIRYETDVDISSTKNVVLVITEAYEGVEVFVDGKSCGIQIMPSFVYDLSGHVSLGKNHLIIEVATTLARERGKKEGRTGITGKVYLYQSVNAEQEKLQ